MKKNNFHTILAIETSCDETATSVLAVSFGRDFPKTTTLSSVVKSQIKLHSKFGGVVPEVAARAHVKNILPVTEQALAEAKIKLADVDYVAVTAGPGLIPSLLVGVEFAKALAFALNKPIIPVNHMLGHLYSPFARLPATSYQLPAHLFPMVSLIVSGGHTILALMTDSKHYRVLGETVDDAAGEAFDKVAKLLRLPYPGGPQVSKLAAKAKQPVNFPRPMINSKNYNFSFSGLKTAVLYYVQNNPATAKSSQLKANICAGFQNAAVDVLVTKTMRAAKEFKAKSISLSGGVAANQKLREALQATSYKLQAKFFVPPMNLCTDNAEMIGLAAALMLNLGIKPKKPQTIKADPNLQL
ncbi:MAG: tRNA (adenosine(37)-N6)-threonylcarbamoyltransferase complex transferase subunit TsaD [Patescibacteria group bacterium]|nr:tRNA (adenosine(37)-N6)-threonylcarbamoyltransferase complex transferase subunit TsaD [Patescibacteria group bacterium]